VECCSQEKRRSCLESKAVHCSQASSHPHSFHNLDFRSSLQSQGQGEHLHHLFEQQRPQPSSSPVGKASLLPQPLSQLLRRRTRGSAIADEFHPSSFVSDPLWEGSLKLSLLPEREQVGVWKVCSGRQDQNHRESSLHHDLPHLHSPLLHHTLISSHRHLPDVSFHLFSHSESAIG
jgi:hypothetical protein